MVFDLQGYEKQIYGNRQKAVEKSISKTAWWMPWRRNSINGKRQLNRSATGKRVRECGT
jgi:hypothetical protein